MAPPLPADFLAAAFSAAGSESLSYTHKDLKWLICNDLCSLLHDFPAFSLAVDTFTHDDGNTVKLINVDGAVTLSSSAMTAMITIWLHQNYPFAPPLIFVSPYDGMTLRHDHPFINRSSGAATCPYLDEWKYPNSNLSGLVGNLVEVFTLCPPYYYVDTYQTSKQEAIDCLLERLKHDKMCFRAEVEGDIENLSSIQTILYSRADEISSAEHKLDYELMQLESVAADRIAAADELSRWLRDEGFLRKFGVDEIDEGFEGCNVWSRCLIECEAKEQAIDDVVEALGRAVEEGVVAFEDYVKQVRNLAREQFFHSALKIKLGK